MATTRWLKAVEVFNEQGERRQLKLFPSEVEPPANDPEVARVLIRRRRRRYTGAEPLLLPRVFRLW